MFCIPLQKSSKCRKFLSPKSTDEAMSHRIALAELVSFINFSRNDNVMPVFKLADLANMYASRLKQMGADSSSRIHRTRLKERILIHCPYLQEKKVTFMVNLRMAAKKSQFQSLLSLVKVIMGVRI